MRHGSDYSALDFGSRNKYRNTIERFARRSGKTELEVTEIALAMTAEDAAAHADEPDYEANVAAFLVGKKRRLLEKRIDYRPSIVQRIVRVSRKLDWLAIAGPNIILTLLAMIAVY